MWPVPAPGPQAPPVVVPASLSSSPLPAADSLIQSSVDSFLKVKASTLIRINGKDVLFW